MKQRSSTPTYLYNPQLIVNSLKIKNKNRNIVAISLILQMQNKEEEKNIFQK